MYTPIKLDKVRNFKYGMRALDRVEKALGKSVNSLDLDELTMDQTATILWAGLVHEDAELTPEKVMDLVDDYSNIVDTVKIMGDAFQAAFSGGKKQELPN